MDALYIKTPASQYNLLSIERELNKAFCSFHFSLNPNLIIATGNWGSGAFHGDSQLKSLIQLVKK